MNYRYCYVNLLACLAFNAKVRPLKINYSWQVLYNADPKRVSNLLFWTPQLDGLGNDCSWASGTNGKEWRGRKQSLPLSRLGHHHFSQKAPGPGRGHSALRIDFTFLIVFTSNRPRRWARQDVTRTFMVMRTLLYACSTSVKRWKTNKKKGKEPSEGEWLPLWVPGGFPSICSLWGDSMDKEDKRTRFFQGSPSTPFQRWICFSTSKFQATK